MTREEKDAYFKGYQEGFLACDHRLSGEFAKGLKSAERAWEERVAGLERFNRMLQEQKDLLRVEIAKLEERKA